MKNLKLIILQALLCTSFTSYATVAEYNCTPLFKSSGKPVLKVTITNEVDPAHKAPACREGFYIIYRTNSMHFKAVGSTPFCGSFGAARFMDLKTPQPKEPADLFLGSSKTNFEQYIIVSTNLLNGLTNGIPAKIGYIEERPIEIPLDEKISWKCSLL